MSLSRTGSDPLTDPHSHLSQEPASPLPAGARSPGRLGALPFYPLQIQRPIFLLVTVTVRTQDKHLVLKNKILTTHTPRLSTPTPADALSRAPARPRHRNSQGGSDGAHTIHTPGAGVPSRLFGMDSPPRGPWHGTLCGGFAVFVGLFVWKCGASVLGHHLPTDGEQHAPVAFRNGVGMTLEMLLHVQCLDSPRCAQLQLVKQKVYVITPTAILSLQSHTWEKATLRKKDGCVLL